MFSTGYTYGLRVWIKADLCSTILGASPHHDEHTEWAESTDHARGVGREIWDGVGYHFRVRIPRNTLCRLQSHISFQEHYDQRSKERVVSPPKS